jgi:hypothetical protein
VSAITDAIARAAREAAPSPPVQIRTAVITDLRRRPITATTAALTLWADFGSGGVQVAALQSVLDQLNTMENASSGSGLAYAVGRTAVTVTPSGNGMPIVIGYVGVVISAIT